MYPALTLSTLLLLIPTLFSSSYAACNKQDVAALLAFKNSFLHTSLRWPQSPTDCCSWDSVGCDSATGRVTSLSFENDEDIPESIFLNGSIPSSVGDLSLESLTFKRISSLQGPIPPQLSKLKKLKSIEIYITQVSGPVPSFLSQLTSLEMLVLTHSRFSGAIPPSLGDLAHLNILYLADNHLTGPIPASLFSKHANGSLGTLELSGTRAEPGIGTVLG